MWDGGVEAGWKEGVEATWEGAVMIGWGPRCERGAQCHEDYMGAPCDNWAVVVFFLLYVSVHNSCRRVVFVWHSVFFVWHPSWPFHGVSTASPSACALPGPLVLSDGTDRGARLGTLSTFGRSHGCLLESFMDTDRGSASCAARARLCSSLAVVVATRPCVSHHQTYSRWPQVRTRTRAIIPKRVRWPPSASALSRRHHRSIRGPTANVPVVADSAFP